MDKAIKRKWVKALRSGKYKQAREALKRGDRYCCLGVLCNVLGAEWVRLEGDIAAVLGETFLNSPGEEVLRPSVLRTLGFTKPRQTKLTTMNDGLPSENIEPHNFNQIADYIEKHM